MGFVALVYFDFYEFIALGFFFDILYGNNTLSIFGIRLFFTVISYIIFILSLYLKSRLKFNVSKN